MVKLSRLMASLLSAGFFLAAYVSADSLVEEPNGDAYNFVTHYRVTIDATPAGVWPVLIDLPRWMYEFDLETITGAAGEPGQVLRLYPGQEFKIQLVAVEPQALVSIVNLPLTFQGEYGTGVGIITLHDLEGRTEVALTMSRRYTWAEQASNPLQARRSSDEFAAQTRAMWQDRFLARLKQLVEAAGTGHTESTHRTRGEQS